MTSPAATYAPISSLKIRPERQRHDFDPAALIELANSIQTGGLLHALAVQRDGVTLVAGERRLRAIREHLVPLGRQFSYGGEPVPLGCVPVLEVGTDDPLELEELELAENIHRRDLSWQERADAESRLHALRAKQNPQQTTVMTAKEVAGVPLDTPSEAPTYPAATIDRVRKSIIVSKYLDNTAVRKAKTLEDAFKVVKRQEEAERVALLGRAVGATHHKGLHKLVRANCLEWMLAYEGPLFDAICTDPPYGMGADQFGDGAGRLKGIEHRYADSYEDWKLLMGDSVQTLGWCKLAYAITKEQAHAYVFCDIDRFHELKGYMEEAGWYVFRTPLINYKVNSGRVPLPDLGPKRQYETILYAIKGKKHTTGLYSDVLPSESDEQLMHGAQKPVQLYVDLLKRSVHPGDLVLDTFAGSGPIFPAAHQLQCIATGIEQEEVSYGRCAERLDNL